MSHGIHYKNIFSYRYNKRFSSKMFKFESYAADTQLTKLASYSDECERIAEEQTLLSFYSQAFKTKECT